MLRKILVALLLLAPVSAFAADLTITAANVRLDLVTSKVTQVTWGETVTAGMPVYKNTTDGKYYKADNDDTAAKAVVAGIAYVGGTVNQVGSIVETGEITTGATMTAGVVYGLSSTLGAICPMSDLNSGDEIVPLYIAVTTTRGYLNIRNTTYNMP